MTGTVACSVRNGLQLLAAARDHQVDERRSICTSSAQLLAVGAEQRDGPPRRVGLDQRARSAPRPGSRLRRGAPAAAAQDHRVAALQAERRGVDRDVGAALVDRRRRRRAARASGGRCSPLASVGRRRPRRPGRAAPRLSRTPAAMSADAVLVEQEPVDQRRRGVPRLAASTSCAFSRRISSARRSSASAISPAATASRWCPGSRASTRLAGLTSRRRVRALLTGSALHHGGRRLTATRVRRARTRRGGSPRARRRAAARRTASDLSPATSRTSSADIAEMPFPTTPPSAPDTSTASPAANAPSADTTPTARSEVPRSRSGARGAGVDQHPPQRRLGVAEPELERRLGARPRARSGCPRGCPRRRAGSRPRRCPRRSRR